MSYPSLQNLTTIEVSKLTDDSLSFGNVELSVSAVKFVSVSLVSSVIEVPDSVVSVDLSSEDLHPKK